jgi:hypothetical protein
VKRSGILCNHSKSVEWIHELSYANVNANNPESNWENIDLQLAFKHIQEDDSDSSGDDAVDDNLCCNYMPVSGFEIYTNAIVSEDNSIILNSYEDLGSFIWPDGLQFAHFI